MAMLTTEVRKTHFKVMTAEEYLIKVEEVESMEELPLIVAMTPDFARGVGVSIGRLGLLCGGAVAAFGKVLKEQANEIQEQGV